jgi:hypothetical protein
MAKFDTSKNDAQATIVDPADVPNFLEPWCGIGSPGKFIWN